MILDPGSLQGAFQMDSEKVISKTSKDHRVCKGHSGQAESHNLPRGQNVILEKVQTLWDSARGLLSWWKDTNYLGGREIYFWSRAEGQDSTTGLLSRHRDMISLGGASWADKEIQVSKKQTKLFLRQCRRLVFYKGPPGQVQSYYFPREWRELSQKKWKWS